MPAGCRARPRLDGQGPRRRPRGRGRARGRDGPARGVLVSLGGDIATAGTAPDGGWRILVAEDSETPADADGELDRDRPAAPSRPRARRSAAGDAPTGSRCTTSSTRGPVCRPLARGGPSRSSRPRASTANTAATAAIVMGERRLARAARRAARANTASTRLGGWPDRTARGRARVRTARPEARARDAVLAVRPAPERQMFDQILWFATRGAGVVSLLMFTAVACLGLADGRPLPGGGLAALLQLRDPSDLALAVGRVPRGPRPGRRLRPVHVPRDLAPRWCRSRRPTGRSPSRSASISLYLFVALIVDEPPAQAHRPADLASRPLVAYAMWPLAVLHGLTAGTDVGRAWMLADRRRVRLRGRGLPRLAVMRPGKPEPLAPGGRRRDVRRCDAAPRRDVR